MAAQIDLNERREPAEAESLAFADYQPRRASDPDAPFGILEQGTDLAEANLIVR